MTKEQARLEITALRIALLDAIAALVERGDDTKIQQKHRAVILRAWLAEAGK